MDEIYGNAALTLAASSAADSREGIFTFPDWNKVPSIPYRLMDDRIGKAFARFYTPDPDAEQPLAARAWAFQESHIAGRVVKFHNDQVV
jgi:hypothetical protein